jgi:ATP-dependent Clp protease ATP-binding subunit ClpB
MRERTGGAGRLDGWPAFVRELDVTLAVHPQYILWGNLHDSFLVDDQRLGRPRLLSLRQLLWEALSASGYQCLLVTDPVEGLRVHPEDGDGAEAAADAAAKLLGDQLRQRPGQGQLLQTLPEQLTKVTRPATPLRAALVIEYASRIARSSTDLDPVERDFFLFCEKLSRTTQPVRVEHDRTTPLYNPVIWLVAREGDLPVWLTAGNDMIRSIGVPPPDFGARQGTARLLARAFGVHDPAADPRAAELCEAFAEQSEGLTLQAMIEATRLARDRGLGFEALPDAVRTYKLGVVDSPWRRDYLRQRIVAGETSVARRVIGQQQAVTKTLDILKRAALGLSGAQASRTSSRPRGVLFFAGPTGVGKTELAKAISAMIFGDESAYLRFDMSEFAAEHAGDRLIGAPPGYVGFEAGGELTNAVRQQPFRVILFDEIEKAHPRILDKFLQILDDGRLTDGRGVTAYFSESILVFTSNLGMVVDDGNGRSRENVRPGLPYEELEARIRSAISDHFTRVLNRPELLNRFGDNIVVFDFIGREAAAHIFDLLLGNIVHRVAEEHRVTLTVDGQVGDTLRDWCIADLSKGGRGIGNALESYFVNPLARALFAGAVADGDTATVSRLERQADIVTLELA